MGLLEELLIYGKIHPKLGFLAVTRHALADEPELLHRLQLSPDDCKFCDLYWVFQNDMFFLSVVSVHTKQPVVTYHRKADIQYGHTFYVETNVCPLTTTAIRTALEYLAIWITDHQRFLENHKMDESEKAVIIINADICVE